MDNLRKTKTKTRWWVACLLAVVALALPQRVSATYVDEIYNYSVTPAGMGVIHAKLPVYCKTGADTWIHDGNLYYVVEGTITKVLLFHWGLPNEFYNNIPDDRPTAMTQMKTDAPGVVTVEPVVKTREDRNPHSETLPKGKMVEFCTYNISDNFYLDITWNVPLELRGKKVTFRWEVTRWGNAPRTRDELTIPSTVCMIPEAQPFFDPYLIEPMVSDSVGYYCLPWMISVDDNKVKNVELSYYGRDNDTIARTLENKASGMVYLKVTDIHKNVKVKVDYLDADNYYIQGRESSPPMDIPMIHPPLNFKATPLDDKNVSVQLSWNTADSLWKDLVNGDLFYIQRSVTSRDEDFVDLTTVAYDPKQTSYIYKDSTLLKALSQQDFLTGDRLPVVKYRICRASTAQWGWGEDNPTVQTASTGFPELKLLKIINTMWDWKSETEHSVKVTWDYGPSKEDCWYVWDDRAQMKLCLKLHQRDGQLIDSVFYELTPKEIQTRTKEIILPRPCIVYESLLYTYQGASPIKNQRPDNGANGYGVPVFGTYFYFESSGKVEKTLMVETRQSSVLLMWDTDGGPIDYFQVLRRNNDKMPWKIIADNITEMSYEDTSVSPLLTYEYMVRSAVDCEGTHYEETEIKPGACKNTGMLEGFIRHSDGIGVPGVKVNISSGSTVVTVETDDYGYFKAEDLSYKNGSSVEYIVQPINSGSSRMDYQVDQYTITFDSTTNYRKVPDFIVTSGYRCSGYVMYKGTNIPVQGARFLVNGHQVSTASGRPLETDFDGKYSFYVNPGNNVVQVVKDGHTFEQEGYYKSKNGSVFNENPSPYYFYDLTKVKLIGRVVGGKAQGDLPLGNNLSRNNLGDKVKMVLALEGDNASWLVYDNLNPNLTERDTVYRHKDTGDGKVYQTKVKTTRKRIEVSPDPMTGEFALELPPVRWKVQQVYCEGYSSLFQNGKVSELLDLSDSITLHKDTHEGTFVTYGGQEVRDPVEEYNAKYNCIYRSPVELDYRQIGYDDFDYFGDKSYTASNLGGDKSVVPLAYPVPVSTTESSNTRKKAEYTFGYPVFSVEKKYYFKLSAGERYYWNNNNKSDTVDIVKVGGGKAIIHNGMESSSHKEEIQLDENGEGYVYLKASQLPTMLTGNDALRTVTFTLFQDSAHFEAKPLKAYVLNIYVTPGAKDILSVNQPLLVDILRDPPGGGSSATLSKGSKLSLAYSIDMDLSFGLKTNFSKGTSLANFHGTVAAPAGAGAVFGLQNSASSEWEFDYDIMTNIKGNRAYNYSIEANEDISTSSSSSMVGADADVYIGVDQNIVVTTASTIRAIPHSVFIQLGGRQAGKAMIEIASGTDDKDSLYHLVRDTSLVYGPVVNSVFHHTQNYILTQIVPSLANKIKTLMFTGTLKEAKALANATGKPVYLSLVDVDDENFGHVNVKDKKPYTYTDSMPDEEGMFYRIVLPSYFEGVPDWDEVRDIYRTIETWLGMISENEYQKLMATDLVKNFSLDGGSTMNYSESFSAEYSNMNSIHLPFGNDGYFESAGAAESFMGVAVNMVGPFAAGIILQIFGLDSSGNGSVGEVKTGEKASEDKTFKTQVSFTGSTIDFNLKPVASYGTENNHTKTKAYERKESFSIGMEDNSHLDFDVYRVKNVEFDSLDVSVLDVFTPQNFYEQVDNDVYFLLKHFDSQDLFYSRGFVYRTRGGATAHPWEDKRETFVYHPGTLLDERTRKIENPIIKLDKQSVSGVPAGEAARFKVYLTNESEVPEAVADGSFFNLFVDETTNPNGAKIIMDGMPLTGSGRKINLTPGEITQKTIEVFAGDSFDYEGITLQIASEDGDVSDKATIDVHFLRSAGNVEISSPSDKWVMNTDAQFNEGKGWFIPVIISGFDKHQRNFDHIEFQYKETARGEDYWTNLCSFYADSTMMAKAGGTKRMIPDNDNIVTEFYGDGPVWEMSYDLRAVLYCRDGNNFVTNSSKVLSGIKDTRRPQLFGNPEPVEGVLDLGGSIVFNFSEDIEHNYLRAVGNFEVKGETNNDDVTTQVSLLFKGKASAETEARRNFTDKEVTIEMLLKPNETNEEMPIFSHGTNGKKLQLWLMPDKHLKAVVDEQVIVSKDTVDTHGFTQVAMVITKPDPDIKNDKWHLEFFNGGTSLGKDIIDEPYTGSGPLIFGRTNEADRTTSKFYQGRMMEARLWYRPLDAGLLGTTYAFKRLHGNEMGLMDYYPMNEGTGDFAIDRTQGANAKLIGTDWAMPNGMSLHLEKEDKGVELQPNAISRTAEQDYTLMFWFRTDSNGRGALISNGNGMATDEGAKNQFYIGFEGAKLVYRSNGMEVELAGDYSDNKWHHYAMTVNRAANLANIYVDYSLLASFKAELLGAISGGHPFIGAALFEEVQEGQSKVINSRNLLRGNIDEICLFEQALPMTLMKNYSTRSPKGDECGLLTYLGFEQQELTSNNQYEYRPYPYSRKIYKDKNGNVVYEKDEETQLPTNMPKKDYFFVDSVDEILKHIDQDDCAPTTIYEHVKNLDFSFVGNNNKIMVNINEPETTIDKCNIYVTVREVADKNGNSMASPMTACFYVKRSPLEWLTNKLEETVIYGEENNVICLIVSNKSANSHTYTIENIPKWMKPDKTSNIISPKDIDMVTAKINPNLNVGTYNEIIYLVDENGFREPLYLTLTVEGEEPDWMVDKTMRQYTMNIIGMIYVNGEIENDERDIIGVFDDEGLCHGVAKVSDVDNLAYINVFSNSTDQQKLSFKLWQYTTGLVLKLRSKDIFFTASGMEGTPSEPVVFNGGMEYVQTLNLEKGWNWVSFNVYDESFRDASSLLQAFPWRNGDVMTDNTTNTTLAYKDNKWYISGNKKRMNIMPSRSYAVNVQDDINVLVTGKIIQELTDRTIVVNEGWNSIGYTPIMGLTVETALSDYSDIASEGDIIKSHEEFAYFTLYNNVGRWQGNLKYMKPGEGYMLLRRAASTVQFTYPFYEPGSTFLDEVTYAPRFRNGEDPFTMSISAITEGVELQAGDKLLAYTEGELKGAAMAENDSVFYLSVEGSRKKAISFAIEREGDIIAVTPEIATFEANGVLGSPTTPTRINFTRYDVPQKGWYTLDGLKLQSKPTKKGVYIFNGKKQVIE